jgi:hypothetical protein
MILNNSVRTAKKTPRFTVTKINWLTLFKEITAVYPKNRIKSINTLSNQKTIMLIVKGGGTYSYH